MPLCCAAGGAARAQERSGVAGVPRLGAARALRLVDEAGAPLAGSFSQPQWETRGDGLFFTREWSGTRNIWRAAPDARDASRYPAWRAVPVTQFEAPLFAFGGVPLAGDGALLVVSNAVNPRRAPQIVRLDLKRPALRALTDYENGAFDPAPSPNGEVVAYAATDGGAATYIQSLRGGAARRVALNARRPAWQDDATLLAESVREATIYRLPLGDLSRRTPLATGTQVSATSDGRVLALSATSRSAPGAARLYLLAGDGSGLRVIEGTEGALHPALSSSGTSLAFDAPLPSHPDGASASLPGAAPPRALWILPLERDPARLAAPDASDQTLADPSDIAPAPSPTRAPRRQVVENPMLNGVPASQGAALPLPSGPLVGAGAPLPAASALLPFPRAPLSPPSVVSPPAEAPSVRPTNPRPLAPLAQIAAVRATGRGVLTVYGVASGTDATATLEIGAGNAPTQWNSVPVTLSRDGSAVPNAAPLAAWTPPSGASGPYTLRLTVSNSSGAARSLWLARLPLSAPGAARPTPTSAAPTLAPSPTFPPGGPLPDAPLPVLPAPPRSGTLLPAHAPRSAGTPAPPRLVAPTPRTGRETPARLPSIAPPARLNGRDGASFNVSGTLATLNAGQKVRVTLWALNRGTRPWDASGPSGTSVVRLVTRWISFEGGSRRKWTLQRFKNPVPPGARTSWTFDVVAPPQAGRYKLIYGLVRVPSGNWEPPPFNVPQEAWPGEFAAIAFAVTVKPARGR